MLHALIGATLHVHARVSRGAELLDRRRPGWADEVDVERLNLAYTEECILGQVYGHYYKGLVALGEPIRIMQPRTASRHGFLESYACWLIAPLCRLEFACLREAWIAVIRERVERKQPQPRVRTLPCRCRIAEATLATAANGSPSHTLIE